MKDKGILKNYFGFAAFKQLCVVLFNEEKIKEQNNKL